MKGSSLKRAIQNLIVLLGAIIVVLIACEFFVRVYERAPLLPLIPSLPTEPPPYPNGLFESSATRGWELKKNYRGPDLLGTYSETNSSGFRDVREYKRAKGESIFRIIVFGDSFTFGAGVAQEKIFTSQLERLLNEGRENSGPRFEVFNFGIHGYNTVQEKMLLSEKALSYQPDMVIINFNVSDAEINDLTPLSVRKPQPSRKAKDISFFHRLRRYVLVNIRVRFGRFYLFAFLRNRIDGILYKYGHLRRGIADDLAQGTEGWKACRQAFRDIKNITEREGIRLLVLIWPQLEHLTKGEYPFFDKHELLKSALREYGIKYIDLFEAFEGHYYRELWVNHWDAHPNARGHLMAAEFVLPELKKEISGN